MSGSRHGRTHDFLLHDSDVLFYKFFKGFKSIN